MSDPASDQLERALALLGPLEARVMRVAWTEAVSAPFVVRDMRAEMPELAYTTVMTTVRRLADKGLLEAETSGRAYRYRASGEPGDFLTRASREEAAEVVERYGDAAFAAFAARLDALSPEQRERLERLRER